MKINPSTSMAIRFTRAQVKNPLGYFCGDQEILEASSCKYLGIILRSDLQWVDQVNYIVQKVCKVLHFVTHALKKRKKEHKNLTYTSFVCPVLEYGAACWCP
jgi:uncharacterized HAD superfamily protein